MIITVEQTWLPAKEFRDENYQIINVAVQQQHKALYVSEFNPSWRLDRPIP
ncbi:hypothetical protein [Rhizobium hidalgonense]|uniref:hypothetical protein n=1 Tax=Rhizobium hidalgonense TaxID=1538159 RepID=UPI0013FE0894|nr:hypothetical protein [Rhizobium hidalgonense]